MHEAETRALRQAAVLLILISVLRWGWAARDPSPPTGGVSVLPELLDASREATQEGARREEPLSPGELVDPNRADVVELDRLPGIGASTASAIVAAREGGAVFHRPEDLLGVRGIGPATLDRVRDFLTLGAPSALPASRGATATPLESKPAEGPIDVNRADLAGLQRLPGVGPAIAERILVARREQPFASLEELVRVRGIGPATVERMRPFATVGR